MFEIHCIPSGMCLLTFCRKEAIEVAYSWFGMNLRIPNQSTTTTMDVDDQIDGL
jgi:hypothetical protein